VPLNLRLNALLDIVKTPVGNEREALVLRIIYSISNADANEFLNFLIKQENGKRTNFEVLYNKMDDGRLARYPFMFLADDSPNRMHFVTAVYNLWVHSMYTFVKPNGDLNLDSYFFNEGKLLYSQQSDGSAKDYTFEFGLIDSYSAQDPQIPNLTVFLTTWANYQCKKGFEKELIPVEKRLQYTKYYENESGNRVGDSTGQGEKRFETKYHMFFPVTITGHKLEGVSVPQISGIPIFILYYSQDFKKLQKIDAAISLGIEIGIEAVLFFTVAGGVTTSEGIFVFTPAAIELITFSADFTALYLNIPDKPPIPNANQRNVLLVSICCSLRGPSGKIVAL